MSNHLWAVDIQAASSAGLVERERVSPIAPRDLPTAVVSPIASESQAALSWRWDLDGDGLSWNIGAAITFAIEIGLEHLFIDVVSVDQSLPDHELIAAVADFTALFGSLRVLAAYDEVERRGSRDFLRVMRRPWIALEISHMRRSRQPVHYVAHVSDQGAAESFGFRHMAERIWSTSFANSILYVLVGHNDMHRTDELRFIVPEYFDVLSNIVHLLTRTDSLLLAALLAQTADGSIDWRVNGDINIRDCRFDRLELMRTDGSPGFWSNWNILLDGTHVGVWSEKDYVRDGGSRRKLAPVTMLEDVLRAKLGVAIARRSPGMETARYKSRVADVELDRLEIVDLTDRCDTRRNRRQGS
ncbi:hypothetical protein ACWCPQ_08160 [Nocardia sp. NPDC001965]